MDHPHLVIDYGGDNDRNKYGYYNANMHVDL